MDDFDTGIFFGEDIAELPTHVGGAVVDEDDFEMFVSLSEDGIDATLEDFGDVIDRDNDGDERIEAGLRGCWAIGGGFGWLRLRDEGGRVFNGSFGLGGLRG